MIPPVTPGQTEEKQNMKNTFNMRQISLMNLAASQLGSKNGTKSVLPSYQRAYSITSPSKSLDILRKNLQNAINKDIDNVLKKYLEKFFQPAVTNIRNNLGKDSVNDDHIKEVCKMMLEEAKSMYRTMGSRDSSPYYSDSETSLADRSPFSTKRKESDTESESNLNSKSYKKVKVEYKPPVKREAPKWNSDRIQPNSLFIMGARANKVLGFGQTRGRLYVRHPNLVRYSGDQEDKEWLASKNLMPPSGGKAYLMLLEDIQELTESDDYKCSPNLQLSELVGFEVPQFILNKIKSFIESSRTDKRNDLFDFRSHSATPPIVSIDSAPSTPSDAPVESSSSKSDNNFVNLPEMSPSSNNSIISNTMTQSPLPSSSGILSPNLLLGLGTDNGTNSMVMLKDVGDSLSGLLANGSDTSQEF